MNVIKNDNQAGRKVWVACRATPSCTGRQSEIKMRFNLPAGGIAIRYRCLTCNNPFHITI
jgi:hypothetical protein